MPRASRPFFTASRNHSCARAGFFSVPCPSRYIVPTKPIASMLPAWAARWKQGNAAVKFPASYRSLAVARSVSGCDGLDGAGDEVAGPAGDGGAITPHAIKGGFGG